MTTTGPATTTPITPREGDAGTPAEGALPSGTAECWADSDLMELVCCQVQEVTHDVKSFVFAPPNGRHFEFEAGQFLTLHLDIDGEPVNRCYTISSPPTRPHRLVITVKRVVEGPVSNWLHAHVRPGTPVRAFAPVGSFTLTAKPAEKYLFLSAGSGITPLMSMTRTLFDLGSNADVLFVHSARTPADIIFRRELDALEAAMPNVRVVHICESDYPSDRWPGLRGRLSASTLQSLAPDLAERVTLTCGPAPYMTSVRRILESVGYDMTRYHEESFSFGELPENDLEALAGEMPHLEEGRTAAADSDPPVELTFTVEFERSGRTVTCGADENVLDAALAAGLRPPSACSQGMCGTCKTTLLSGEVDMKHNGGIRPKEVALGKVLICCSKPLSDLRIDS
jgi:ferredoxin-NADP reductase